MRTDFRRRTSAGFINAKCTDVTADERFDRMVVRLPTGCWEWQGARDCKGYGRMGDPVRRGKTCLAHRHSFQRVKGSIANGLFVCHRCDNPPCVNPDHLFLGTNQENGLDSSAKGRVQRYNAAKTHCIRGHAFDSENTGLSKVGKRFCLICKRTAYPSKKNPPIRLGRTDGQQRGLLKAHREAKK